MKSNNLVVGILAHVDSGKTTLAESLLYHTGSIRSIGRVDHKNTFLDTEALEKERGITIFSKQAQIQAIDYTITLLDTPGHVDFSTEMERALQIMDYAILVISASDGITGHVQTLWKLLERYQIPVFIFCNKMDLFREEKAQLLQELEKNLHSNFVDFSRRDSISFYESLAVSDEALLEKVILGEEISQNEIAKGIGERKIVPCFYGSALKQEGIEDFWNCLQNYMIRKEYPDTFGARIYKITRDTQGNRLTHIKVTGGSLRVREKVEEEKINQIRIYSGSNFEAVSQVEAGEVCALTGLTQTLVGQGIGMESDAEAPMLEPIFSYKLQLEEGYDLQQVYLKIKILEEEEPQLQVVWEPSIGEIHLKLMGEVQIEILQSQILTRFGLRVSFVEGSIIYKETICNTVEGVGHYEPLRHYSEVHLLLEPGERGSGIQCALDCDEELLPPQWQRLVLGHIEEKVHRGVLAGYELTDVMVTLVSGKAHQKHTEGGDFREASYRAIRQGLMQAQSALLEPIYAFRVELPTANVGRAMTDLQRMQGKFEITETAEQWSVLEGTAPVFALRGYYAEVLSYTKGAGKLTCVLKGYDLCHNQEEVLEKSSYEPLADFSNPCSSVFCAHGAGFVVPWNEVFSYMHLELRSQGGNLVREKEIIIPNGRTTRKELSIDQEQIEEIFSRTFQSNAKQKVGWKKGVEKRKIDYGRSAEFLSSSTSHLDRCLLVDGYNIIFAWEELKGIAENNIDGARDRLIEIMANYQAYKDMKVIVVFDAYRVARHAETISKHGGVHVVFTREAETADHYIEKTVEAMKGEYQITVATSDALEQMIIWGKGAMRMSALGLYEEVMATNKQIVEQIENLVGKEKIYLGDMIKKDEEE